MTVVVGGAVFVFLLWEPHIEGRNAHATLFQIYFNDPFLAVPRPIWPKPRAFPASTSIECCRNCAKKSYWT
jgi:hypothetical protein